MKFYNYKELKFYKKYHFSNSVFGYEDENHSDFKCYTCNKNEFYIVDTNIPYIKMHYMGKNSVKIEVKCLNCSEKTNLIYPEDGLAAKAPTFKTVIV